MTSAKHWSSGNESHDYAREERQAGDDIEFRMKCSCGAYSRWTELVRKVREAQDAHADRVARGAR